MLLLKICLLQIFWFLAVSSHGSIFDFYMLLLSMALVLWNYFLFSSRTEIRHYVVWACLISSWGIAQDYLAIYFGFIELTSLPFWLISLWVSFSAYYTDVFKKFAGIQVWKLSIIGGVGGAIGYYSGVHFAGIDLLIPNKVIYFLWIFLSWAIFFPLSIKEYYGGSILNKILDLSIIFSFDKTGFFRHKKYFKNEEFCNLENKKILVTGGTSGIGREVTKNLSLAGSKLVFTGRNSSKGKIVESDKQKFYELDMADWESINPFVSSIKPLDGIVLNAGGMPDKYTANKCGVELQVASQLFGHYFLVKKLIQANKLTKGAKIIWVSSGGMYLKKLDIDNLTGEGENYDKVRTYANVKRAQVTLVEELAKDSFWNEYEVVTMHPGWVGTDGVKDALPKFYKFLGSRLRNVEQGADTIVWLLKTKEKLESGAFYFDRKVVSPYISKHFVPTDKQRAGILSLLDRYWVP